MKLTIEADSLHEAIFQLQAFAGKGISPLEPVFPPFNVSKNAVPLGDPAPGDTAKGDPAPTYEETYAAIKALLGAKGKEATSKLLADYGATGAGDLLDKGHAAAFTAAVKALLP